MRILEAPLIDVVKSYDYDFIRIKTRKGGVVKRQDKIIDEQLKLLLADVATVELLTEDTYVIINTTLTHTYIDELKRIVI